MPLEPFCCVDLRGGFTVHVTCGPAKGTRGEASRPRPCISSESWVALIEPARKEPQLRDTSALEPPRIRGDAITTRNARLSVTVR